MILGVCARTILTDGIENYHRLRNLLKSLKDGKITQKTFFKYFYKEVITDGKKMELCRRLALESLNKMVTLLCYEKEETSCHRYYLKKLCEQELSRINSRESL